MLGHELTKRYAAEGLPEQTIHVKLSGTAGQSLGAFIPRGLTLELAGDANDYVAKGLSGGEVIVYPPASAGYLAHDNVIAGNVIGYGATSGSIFISGVVGERFMVRNSGATAVVEGVGDHALEYMTGGTVCIIGETGRNFGAGFSGGTAYVYQLNKDNVNAQALTGGELLFTELSDDDAEIVHELLTRHVEKTSSVFAQTILQDFDNARSKFVKVLPRDYANVTRIRAEAAVSGLDPDGDEVWQQILEGTHG
jgi:glutamate synthase (NADPH/NADH) large chain